MKEERSEEEGEREVVRGDSESVLEDVEGRESGEEEEKLASKTRTTTRGLNLKSGGGSGKRRAESLEQRGAKRAHIHHPEVTVDDTHVSSEQSREVKDRVLLDPSSDGEEMLHGNQQKDTRSLVEGNGHQTRELAEVKVDTCSSNQRVSGSAGLCGDRMVLSSDELTENGGAEGIGSFMGKGCHRIATCDSIAGTRGIAKNGSNSSKGHILVDLLTSTVDSHGHYGHVNQGSEVEGPFL